MFDEGADWGVVHPAIERASHGRYRTWGSKLGYHRNWCTAFARTAFRHGYAAVGTPMPLDLCPATATVPQCEKITGTTREMNNQSQTAEEALRYAFEQTGLWVAVDSADPVVPGREHVAIVTWVERTAGPRGEWRAHLIQGNYEDRVDAEDTIALGSPRIEGYGRAERAVDPAPTYLPAAAR